MDPSQPTVTSLRSLLDAVSQARADASLAALRAAVGPVPDPADPAHAEALYAWLNKWGCRLGKARREPFAPALAGWWRRWEPVLPRVGQDLAGLDDDAIEAVAEAFEDLRGADAFADRNGRVRRVGPTAASKLLYALRPDAVVAWDGRISRTSGGNGRAAYALHLRRAQIWARALEAEAAKQGLRPAELPAALGRPHSTLAKILDEYLYLTISRGHPSA